MKILEKKKLATPISKMKNFSAFFLFFSFFFLKSLTKTYFQYLWLECILNINQAKLHPIYHQNLINYSYKQQKKKSFAGKW